MAMHDCKDELRQLVSSAHTQLGLIHADKDLSAEGRRNKREEVFARAVETLAQGQGPRKRAAPACKMGKENFRPVEARYQ
jgi:hypothetical protein